jgi:hypothetical protein
MDINGIEYRIAKNEVERLTIDLSVIIEGVKETHQIVFAGNNNTGAFWGLERTVKTLNEILGYKKI